MFKLIVSLLVVLLGLAGVSAQATVITTDFEVGAPCAFFEGASLANISGASFAGVDGPSGYILDECGNFGVSARSGSNFYAFNTIVDGTGSIVDITFGGLIDSFSIWGSSGFDINGLLAQAFLGQNLLFSDFETSAIGSYSELMLSGGVFDRVRLSYTNDFCCAVFDDMSFNLVRDPNQVPLPASLALVGIGLAALGATRCRKLKLRS